MNDDPPTEESPDTAHIIESERATTHAHGMALSEVLQTMGEIYHADPVVAVRGQKFIQPLHRYLGTQLEARLTSFAM
jgi:hypothetical protein